MRSFFSFRLSAQLCLVSGLLCTLPVFRGDWRMLVLLALLSFFACCFAVRVSQLGGRLFLGMLPLAVLPLASGTPSLVACGLLAGYAALSLTLGRFTQEHWRYRKEAALTLLVCGLAELLTVVNEPIYNLPSCLFFLAAALGTIVALRSLRIGFAHRIGWQLGSPVAVLSLATLGVGLTVFGLPLLKALFLPFGSVLTALLRLLSSGMTAFFRLISGTRTCLKLRRRPSCPQWRPTGFPRRCSPVLRGRTVGCSRSMWPCWENGSRSRWRALPCCCWSSGFSAAASDWKRRSSLWRISGRRGRSPSQLSHGAAAEHAGRSNRGTVAASAPPGRCCGRKYPGAELWSS